MNPEPKEQESLPQKKSEDAKGEGESRALDVASTL